MIHGSLHQIDRKYVDLQYTIEGGEWIAWEPATSLTPEGDYDPEADLQFYRFTQPQSRVWMAPGRFAIYYPGDAHLPRIADSRWADVFKVVIKLGRHLLV